MRTKFHYCFIGMALLAGVHPVLAQPALGIVQTNNQVILFWPITGDGTNGDLQSATDLVSQNWLAATDAFAVNYGSQIAVSVTNVSAARFFRLSLVPPTADGMALIPAGSFTMGDTLEEEVTAIPTSVYVSAFYMDTNLVSSNQWATVYSYATSHGYSFDNAGSGNGTNYPLDSVDWYDCVKWCNARSKQAGLVPVYYTDAGLTQVYTNGDVDAVYVNWATNGYRLPTEAEWEKAARGGLSGQRFPWGDTISWSQANYYGGSGDTYDLEANNPGFDPAFTNSVTPFTSPVGYFAANGYGLNDMAGNVDEWCWDWWDTPYGQPTTTNPTGPATGTGVRVERGGSWGSSAFYAQCAARPNGLSPIDAYPKDFGLTSLGFRCVRGLPNTPASMAFIPAGSFTIGNSIGDSDIIDANPTNVYVSAFYMDVNLVSSNQWAGVYTYATSQGYVFYQGAVGPYVAGGKAANYPVETVDWYDCVKWSNARSQQAGLTPVYYTDAGLMQVYTNGDNGTTVYANWGANGYRLPTEAEWEKAARGGLSGQRFPWGDTISESQANYYATNSYSYDLGPNGYNTNFDTGAYPYTSPVGYFAPNGYGLNDMAGNVFEWCWDWYAEQTNGMYPTGSPYLGGTDPRGPASSPNEPPNRVLRGGDWSAFARFARCAFRNSGVPNYAGIVFFGFRCVRGL